MLDKDFLIEEVERDCPYCNKVHKLDFRRRTDKIIMKDKSVEYEEFYYLCPLVESQEEDNEFVPAKLMDENLSRAKYAYHTKH